MSYQNDNLGALSDTRLFRECRKVSSEPWRRVPVLSLCLEVVPLPLSVRDLNLKTLWLIENTIVVQSKWLLQQKE